MATRQTGQDKTQKIVDIWARFINPLWNLTQRQIEEMLNMARSGNDVMLQQSYELIEQTMPIFGICIDKRQSQIMDLEWKVCGEDGKKTRASRKIEDIFKRNEEDEDFDNIHSAIEHLSLYSFRGRSCVKPFFNDGKLVLKKLNNWNILLHNNRFYFNPSSMPTADLNTLVEVPSNEIAFCHTSRAIDLPGMLIYLRQLVGETKWAQFVERMGIPQVVITSPEGTPDSAQGTWLFRAQQIMNGGSGVLPPGAKVDQLVEARNQDPFSDFCRHQMEMIAILSTGGTLNTLGGNTGLGSNLADVQNEQFLKLVKKDMRQIESAMTKVVKLVAMKSGMNAEGLRFKFSTDEDSTQDVLETAKAMKELGIGIDVQKMKKYVKYDIFSENEQKDLWMPSNDGQTESDKNTQNRQEDDSPEGESNLNGYE